MSKMSEFHMELEEQAYDLGYESLTQALEAGYTIDYKEKKLISLDELQAIAHEEWLREKKVVLGDLKNLLIGMGTAGKSDTTEFEIIRHAIEFIEEGEH